MVQPVVIAAIIVVALSSLTTFFMAIYLCKLNEWLCFNVQRDGSGNVIKTAEEDDVIELEYKTQYLHAQQQRAEQQRKKQQAPATFASEMPIRRQYASEMPIRNVPVYASEMPIRRQFASEMPIIATNRTANINIASEMPVRSTAANAAQQARREQINNTAAMVQMKSAGITPTPAQITAALPALSVQTTATTNSTQGPGGMSLPQLRPAPSNASFGPNNHRSQTPNLTHGNRKIRTQDDMGHTNGRRGTVTNATALNGRTHSGKNRKPDFGHTGSYHGSSQHSGSGGMKQIPSGDFQPYATDHHHHNNNHHPGVYRPRDSDTGSASSHEPNDSDDSRSFNGSHTGHHRSGPGSTRSSVISYQSGVGLRQQLDDKKKLGYDPKKHHEEQHLHRKRGESNAHHGNHHGRNGNNHDNGNHHHRDRGESNAHHLKPQHHGSGNHHHAHHHHHGNNYGRINNHGNNNGQDHIALQMEAFDNAIGAGVLNQNSSHHHNSGHLHTSGGHSGHSGHGNSNNNNNSGHLPRDISGDNLRLTNLQGIESGFIAGAGDLLPRTESGNLMDGMRSPDARSPGGTKQKLGKKKDKSDGKHVSSPNLTRTSSNLLNDPDDRIFVKGKDGKEEEWHAVVVQGKQYWINPTTLESRWTLPGVDDAAASSNPFDRPA